MIQPTGLTRKSLLLVLLLPAFMVTRAQTLQPGFDANEYLEMLRITSMHADSQHRKSIPSPESFQLVYRSTPTPLDNLWDLWTNANNSIIVISIRGTTLKAESWLENFYCAMIPAKGSLQTSDSTTFNYQFSNDPKATVHVGWTLGLAGMAPGMIAKIKEYYTTYHTKQIVVMGHSQGGALSFLLRSYLYYQVQQQQLPADLVIKTYCSAAPKPGNLYYAYDFDYITRNGWAFTVVNAADWVPETPFSLQTLRDYNTLNPFTDVSKQLNKQSFLVRLYLKHVYNRLNRTSGKAQRVFTKYLGKTLYKQVKKSLPQYRQPTYAASMNYMRAGVPIVLQPDDAYREQFPDSSKNVFIHHGLWPYYGMMKRIYGER